MNKEGKPWRYSVDDYRHDVRIQDELARNLNRLRSMARKDEITVCFLGFDGNTYPNNDELRFLANESFYHSDIVPLPIISKLKKRVNRSNFSEYKRFLQRAYEEYSTLNNKRLMGIIPNLSQAFVEDLVDFYVGKDMNSFFFDFDGSSPSTKYASIINFHKRLNDYGLVGDCFVYSLNSSIGRGPKPVIEAKDILSYGFGFDVLGRYEPPPIPSGVKPPTPRIRFFNKEDYGYYGILWSDIGSFYPKDSYIPLQTLKNVKPKPNKDGDPVIDYTVPSLLNLEQKGLETLRLRKVIDSGEIGHYIDSKKYINKKDKKNLMEMKNNVFNQTRLNKWTS